MKLTAILIMVSTFGLLASETYAQSKRLTLKMENAKVEEVLANIQKQSEFYFFVYSEKVIDADRRVTVNLEEQNIETVLQTVFAGTDVAYLINDRLIVLTTPEVLGKVSPAVAQQQPAVSGKVTDESGQPLPGVTIVIKGTTQGTVTNADGEYSISSLPDDATLRFSFVGMRTQEVVVGNQTRIDVRMVVDAIGIEEVVAIGYGTMKKVEITSAVSNVQSKDFIKGSVKDAGQLLQGKVAGLNISTVTGNPTSGSEILLRGIATLSTSTAPLVLIDGIPGNLNTVAPEDIASIDVLKDGSAAAIYGTRGTNGVILITTQKPDGRHDPTLTYDGYVSTQEWVRVPDMLSAAEYRQKISEGVSFFDEGTSTDWIKEISREFPLTHNHHLSFRGGDLQTNYLASFTYRNTEGIIKKFAYQTMNTRIDINHNMIDNKLRFNLNLINNDGKSDVNFGDMGAGLSDSPGNSIFNQALWRNPTSSVKNADGSWTEQPAKSYYENPVAMLNETYGGTKNLMTRINGRITYEPVKDLLLNILASKTYSSSSGAQGQTKKHLSATRDGLNGRATKSAGRGISDLLEVVGEYKKEISSHNLTLLGGYSYQSDESEYESMLNWNFPAGNFSYIDNIGAGLQASEGGRGLMSSSKYKSNLISFFGRVNYDYLGKYLLMGSLRYEASSKFVGTDKPWGTFPSISVGWRLSQEQFMQSMTFLSDLKLRAGYGVTGTAPSQMFLGVSLLGYSGSSLINGKWVPSLRPTRNPNPYLRWEEKHETNLGMDFSLFNYRVSGSIDYYKRKTDGLLYDYSVPVPPNAYGTTTANVGVMENKGVEVLINARPVEKNKFSWHTTVTYSTNTNKLVSLSNELYTATNPWFNAGSTGSPVQTYTHRVEVGEPIGDFWGYKVTGITSDGHWIYEDKDGNSSDKRVENDKKKLGNGLPKWYLSWNNSVNYGNWDLNVTMRGAFGYQILNMQRMYSENPGFTSYNLMNSAFDKVYGEAVLSKDVPPEFNSYYLEDGDFWKIDNISIGYNFNTAKSKRLGSSRLSFSVLNAFIFTGYKGMDPEVSRSGLYPGDDNRYKYPTTRVYSLNWNVTIK